MLLRALTWSFAIFSAAALFLGAWNLALLASHGGGKLTVAGILIDFFLIGLWSTGLVASVSLMNRRAWGRRLLQAVSAALAALTASLLVAEYVATPAIGGRSSLEWTLSLVALMYFVAVSTYLGTGTVILSMRDRPK